MERPANYSSLRRIGDLKHSARRSDHDGWILLDGRTIARADYPKLFAVLDIAADEVTLPNGTDALLLGAGGRLKAMERGGANTVTLTLDNLPEHAHGYTDAPAEPAMGKAGLLGSVLPVATGLTTSQPGKTTDKAGKANPTPVEIKPVAIGANIFIYAGRLA